MAADQKITEVVDFNPPRAIKRGTVAPFVDMAALPENQRDIAYVSEREFSGGGARFQNGDTLFARITPCLENGKTAKVDVLPAGSIAHGSTEFIVMAAKAPEYDEDYIYYLARHPEFRAFAEARMEGTSGRQRVSWQVLSDFSFSFPPPNQRKIIGSILRKLDDKIGLNRRINQTLSAMAQAIFKSWFVDFDPVKAKIAAIEQGQDPLRAAMRAISGKTDAELDQMPREHHNQLAATAALFPDAMEESELGEIPKGWEVVSLYETANYLNGAAFRASDFSGAAEALPIIKIAELKQGVNSGTKRTLKEIDPKYQIKSGDVLYSWSGSPDTSLEVFRWFGVTGLLNQHIFKLSFSHAGQREYTYYLLKEIKPILVATAKQKQTTGLGHITVADMKRIKVARPKISDLKNFTQQLKRIYAATSECEQQVMTLAALRDILLPKLLSGELSPGFDSKL